MDAFYECHRLHLFGNPEAKETLIFAHGFGSEQSVWRHIWPTFQSRYRIVLFDLVGSGFNRGEDFNLLWYQTLGDYAADLIKIADVLQLQGAILVAHSVSCMLGTLAALKRPDLFQRLIFICGSPRYINDGAYIGGFSQEQVAEILEAMADNYTHWVQTYAPVVMKNPQRPALAAEFSRSLLKLRPDVALVIFNLIMLSDHRREVSHLTRPVLILQAEDDVFVPRQVGEYLHQVIPQSQLRWITAPGHFPHLSHPAAIITALEDYLAAPA